jgi:hypothetical protein
MKKNELVYLELAMHAYGREKIPLTQLMLSRELGISLNTVNNAIAPLRRIGAVIVRQRSLAVSDAKKLILYWASVRNLQKDICWQTRAEMPPSQIEKNMPSGAVFTAYSAYKFLFGDVPADYSEIYVYADEEDLQEIMRRFPKKDGPANLFALKAEDKLLQMAEKGIAPLPQIYADLWNLPQWYARDFLEALEKRLGW